MQHVTQPVMLRAKLNGAVYCNRSCLFVCEFVCLFLWVCLFVGLLPWLIEIACIDPHQSLESGSVGEGDHLQLIKFWPSYALGKRVCGGSKIFGSALLQPARSVCVSPSAFFILSCALTLRSILVHWLHERTGDFMIYFMCSVLDPFTIILLVCQHFRRFLRHNMYFVSPS